MYEQIFVGNTVNDLREALERINEEGLEIISVVPFINKAMYVVKRKKSK